VALEDDAEEVEDLALLPVGVAPQVGDRGTTGLSRGVSTLSVKRWRCG